MERLCSFCRQPNHQKPKCPEFLGERKSILEHTPRQRLLTMQILAQGGWGIGSMIRLRNYDETESIAIMRDFSWIGEINFLDARNRKYSKRVVLTFNNVLEDFDWRRINANMLITGNGGAREGWVGVYPTDIYRTLKDKDYQPIYNRRPEAQLVSPSYELDYDESWLVSNIWLPERLRLPNEGKGYMPTGVTGIMPEKLPLLLA